MEDPVPETLVSFENDTGSNVTPPKTLDQLLAAHAANPVWKVEPISQFNTKDNDGTGWVHVEYHTKILTAIPPS